jgi:predicted RNase H-like HicB family nuclease
MKYLVVFEQTPTAVRAYVPDLPGCVAVGDTHAEAERLIAEAMALHLAGMREDNLPIPEPSAKTILVEVA